jgi:hypothetical protein
MRTIRFGFILLSLLLTSGLVFAQQDVTVYVTKTGAKYHSAGCSYLSKSSIPMKLSEASARYSPCSKCNPPTMTSLKSKSAAEPKKVESTTPTKVSTSKGTEIGTTPTGKTLYQGPRGGIYHISKSGKKVYHSKKK